MINTERIETDPRQHGKGGCVHFYHPQLLPGTQRSDEILPRSVLRSMDGASPEGMDVPKAGGHTLRFGGSFLQKGAGNGQGLAAVLGGALHQDLRLAGALPKLGGYNARKESKN